MEIEMQKCPKCGFFGCDGNCNDLVEHPNHYTAGGIEVNKFLTGGWDMLLGFNLCNVIKYACRANLKGQKEQDLRKIIQYAEFELERCRT